MKPKEKYERARVLPIPTDWNQTNDGYALVTMCIPNSVEWRSIILGSITTLAHGRTWNRQTGSIRGAQEIAREIYESIDMTCMTDILDAINSITMAIEGLELSVENSCNCSNGDGDDMTTIINNYGCGCCGDGSSQTVTTDGTNDTPQDIFNPPGVDGPVNQQPPPGFQTWGDYTDHKCAAAHELYDQVFDSVGAMDTWIAAALTSGFGSALNLISGAQYYWMTSENLSTFGSNLFNWAIAADRPPTYWGQFQAELAKQKDLIVCTAYESPDATQAILEITDVLGGIGDALLLKLGYSAGGPLGAAVAALIGGLVPTALANNLFQYSSNVPDNSDKTCNCGGEPPANTGVCYSMNTVEGTGTVALLSDDGSTQVWRVTPEYEAGLYKVNLQAYNDSNVKIPYQATALAENDTGAVTFSTILVTYEDGSTDNVFGAGCIDFLRYESADGGWTLDVTVDLTAMNNCAGCTSAISGLPQNWLYDTDDEEWTYTDQSSPQPANSATMAYEVSTQALRCSFNVASGADQDGRIHVNSPALNIAPDGNDRQFFVNLGAPSDGIATGSSLIFKFATNPDVEVSTGAFSAATQIQAVTSVQDTIVGVTVLLARATGGGNGPWAFTVDILDTNLISL